MSETPHGESLPQLLLSCYGDDFTGSTDVMEVMTGAGYPCYLFLDPPTPEQLAKFPDLRAFVVAGVSRSLSPEEMERELLPIFTGLCESGAKLIHYKICSTFDSSPQVGSIGRAIDVGQSVFHSPVVPLLVGAPRLGRYTVFGNLWARAGLDTEPFRLDRHPAMSRHPMTPMDESDLRLHLSKQTERTIGLFDILQYPRTASEQAEKWRELHEQGAEIVLIDVLYDEQLPAIGEHLWNQVSSDTPLYVVGSSGVEYALTAYWQPITNAKRPLLTRSAVEQVFIVSGSGSPVTARQIDHALMHGFAEVPLDPVALLAEETAEIEVQRAIESAGNLLQTGASVVVHTCRGPEDPRLLAVRQHLRQHGLPDSVTGSRIGTALGKILRAVCERTDLPRLGVTGGDTSGYVARTLGIEALEMVAPLAPGSPLCRIHAPASPAQGREIVFKGGQVGKADWFPDLLRAS
ncbi:MAG: four-carbon acid sugar kinase family protein [Armatimonadaceae bacterium]